MRFRREHVESASETPRYLQFFVDLTNFSAEFANGPTFIRSVIEFSIYLIWRVFTCDLCGREQTLRCVQFFLSVVALGILYSFPTSNRRAETTTARNRPCIAGRLTSSHHAPIDQRFASLCSHSLTILHIPRRCLRLDCNTNLTLPNLTLPHHPPCQHLRRLAVRWRCAADAPRRGQCAAMPRRID